MSFSHARLGVDVPNGQIELDGIRYWTSPVKETRFESSEMIIVFEGAEIVNKCDACGRSDARPRMASSWEDAIRKGWVRRVCGWTDVSSSADNAANQVAISFECGQHAILGNPPHVPRSVLPDRYPWIDHDCRLEQIPGDPTSVGLVGTSRG